MLSRTWAALTLLSAMPAWAASHGPAARAILENRCFACHGQARTSGLDLRQSDSMRQGGKRGPAVIPGKAAESLLYRAVLRSGELQMPPGKPLPTDEIATLRAWIEEGAPWDASAPESNWWSFRPVARPAVPALNGARNPIDAFLLATLREKGLHAVAPADRRTLIRRVSFDLTGLPPTPEEVRHFDGDPAPDAWEKLVDRLLASPRYGERWGRHWLDVVRYADTGGFETDMYYANAWRYRDYVIQSFNADKPYDRFVQEQIAGDELWPDNLDLAGGYDIPPEKLKHLEARIGTTLYTIGPTYHEAALNGDQLRYEWLSDAVDTTGEAFLGVTLACARCHNHKFDPLTQRDYHRMMAIFAGSEEREVPVVSMMNVFGFKSGYPSILKVDEYKAAIQRIDQNVRERMTAEIQARVPAAGLERALTEAGLRENASGKVFEPVYTPEEKDERERLIHELGKAALAANFHSPTATILGHADVIPEVHLTSRGDFHPTGPIVGPGFPAVLGGTHDLEEPPTRPFVPQRRKALALWLTRPDHPLTARVIVNRVWAWHFGKGIVATPNDFGRQGEPPSHPELLDWLASEFVRNGWSLKKLHKLILLSDAYQRSSAPDQANDRIDPPNRYLWRMNRQRMDAETLRDSVLSVAGTLNLKMGGRPVVPPLTEEEKIGMWALNQWPVSLDPAEHNRRSVYLYVKRSFPFPMFAIFDQPESSVSCPRRDVTTVAPQALALLNSSFMLQQAGHLAARVRKLHPSSREAQVREAWQVVAGRAPSAPEQARALQFLSGDTDLTEFCLVLLNTNEFVYVD